MSISHIVKLPIESKASFAFNREGGTMGISSFKTEIGANGALVVDFEDADVNQAFYFLTKIGVINLSDDDGISATFPVSLDVGIDGIIKLRLAKIDAEFVSPIPSQITEETINAIIESTSIVLGDLKSTDINNVDGRLAYVNQIYSQWKVIADADPRNIQARHIVAKASEIIAKGVNVPSYGGNLSSMELGFEVNYYDWKAQFDSIYDANRDELKNLFSNDINARKNAALAVVVPIEALAKPVGLDQELGFFGHTFYAPMLTEPPGTWTDETHRNHSAAWHDYAVLVRENAWYSTFNVFRRAYI